MIFTLSILIDFSYPQMSINEFEERDDKCVNCLEINPREVKIKCEECPGDLLLCLECFSCGVEVGQHKKNHSYSFYDPASFPLFTPDWCAADELQLLEALEEFGYGDWEQCTRYLSDRTPGEICSHFEEFYLSGVIANYLKDVLRDPAGKSCLLSPSLTVTPMRVEVNKTDCLELGYLPKRDDFEREYDNSAEELISKLVATHNDEPIEAKLKFTQVQIYNKRLKDRALRKKIAREYGLVCDKQRTAVVKGKKMDQKELRSKLLPFARFMTCTQFDKLACGITKSEKLKEKIAELLAFRNQGVTKMNDSREYEVRRMQREKRRREEKIGNTPPKRLSFNSMKSIECTSKSEKEVGEFSDFKSLSKNEKDLCSSLQLTPQKYMSAKMCIIREKLHRDLGLPSNSKSSRFADSAMNLSSVEKLRITEYLRSAGFISLAT